MPKIVLANALRGLLPLVVVGLFIHLVLSRSGPLDNAGLLFKPTGIIIAHRVLAISCVRLRLSERTRRAISAARLG
jgi:tungstate transport system permease protein